MSYYFPSETKEILDIDIIGGKAHGLTYLSNKGHIVPEGIYFTISFFDLIASDWMIDEKKKKLLDYLLLEEDEKRIKQYCINIQKEICDLDFSENAHEILEQVYSTKIKDWNNGFCIRSSANKEDSFKTSFAGSFDSYLKLKGESSFFIHVKKLISQIFKYEVIVNCIQADINPNELKMGILVQEYTQCSIYGVSFSANPNPVNFDQIVASIATQGEELMSGEGDNKTYVLEKKSPNDDIPIFLNNLVTMTMEVEEDKKYPLDMEWGIREDKLIFFQMRPMTSIRSELQSNVIWSRDLAEERYPEPISPLGWSILREVFQTNLSTLKNRFGIIANSPDDVAITINNYVYANTSFFSISNMLPHFRSLIPMIPKILVSLVKTFFYFPLITIKKILGKSPLRVKDFLTVQIFDSFIFFHASDILTAWDKNLKPHLEQIDKISQTSLEGKSIEDLYKFKADLKVVADKYMEPDLAIYIVKIACEWLIKKIFSIFNPESSEVEHLIKMSQGLENNRSLEMAQSLDNVLSSINNNTELKTILLEGDQIQFWDYLSEHKDDEIEEFLDLNGHLTVNWDFRVPTWQENRGQIFNMLKSLVSEDNRKSIKIENKKKYDQYLVDLNSYHQQIDIHHFMVPFHNKLVTYFRQFMRIDEEHHFYCSRVFKILRELYLSIGQRLVEKKIISDAEDIFFFKSDELDKLCQEKNFFSRRYLIKKRRRSFDQSFNQNPPDEYILGKGLFKTIEKLDGDYLGIGASQGMATGKVRIIKSLEDSQKVQKGDIIVTASPNPVYIPLYSIASGLVANTGSILSHGLVAAREYQIPAVIGLANICNELVDGQEIKINGTNGTITIIS